MRSLNLEAASRNLPELVTEVESTGGEVILRRGAVPVAKLVAFQQRTTRRRLGGWEGRIRVLPGFDEQVGGDWPHP